MSRRTSPTAAGVLSTVANDQRLPSVARSSILALGLVAIRNAAYMITAKVWAAKITTIQSNVHPIVAHGPQRRGDDAELFGTDGTRSTSPSRGGRASGRSGSTGLIGD